MKRLKTCLRALGLLLSLALPAGLAAMTEVQNVTISSSNPAAGSTVTICFQARDTGGANVTLGVAFGPSGFSGATCANYRQLNWVLWDGGGVYRGGNLAISGTSKSTTSQNYTNVLGLNTGGGVNLGVATSWATVCFETTVPPEFSGGYTVVVVPLNAGDSNRKVYSSGSGCYQCQANGTIATTTFTAGGTPLHKINLQTCAIAPGVSSCPTGAICFRIKITNYGESGIRLQGFTFKFCFYDTTTTWEGGPAAQFFAYMPGGAQYCNNVTGSGDSVSFEAFTTVDCGADGAANRCLVYSFGNTTSDTWPYYIPPNGGWIESDPASIPAYFRPNPAPANTPTTSDDYSNMLGAPACGSGWSERQKVALYNGGSLVCEWDSSTTSDQQTGVPYCGSTGGCNNCPTGSVSNLARNSTGASNVVCIAIYSPTPTPVMQLTKVADRTTGGLGDTITYTISWANNASAARTMVIWDTVPTNTTYVGCNAPVGSCSQSGGLVTWSLGSQAAGSSGSVTFWVTISSLPFLPNWLEERQALGPPAPRSRELQLGLWDPLQARSLPNANRGL